MLRCAAAALGFVTKGGILKVEFTTFKIYGAVSEPRREEQRARAELSLLMTHTYNITIGVHSLMNKP